MKRIGIFGGTFNPVHKGHISLALWLVGRKAFDEVWLTLSPANPLKDARPGATDADRREMLTLACNGHAGLKPCFVEFDMPRPSYSIATLRRLAADCPDCRFSPIIGSDNWHIFHKWRSRQEIIADYGVTIYPRPGYPVEEPLPAGVTYMADAPVCDVSSTDIRRSIRNGSAGMLPDSVESYIKSHNLYGYARQQAV